jgi:hypothetical protein
MMMKPGSDRMSTDEKAEQKQDDPRRQTLIDSLRARFARAVEREDAPAKQALFKEAAYLGIRPEQFQDWPAAATPSQGFISRA